MNNLRSIPILGIDPGFALIGYGLLLGGEVLDYGVIKTSKEDCVADRLLTIDQDVPELIYSLPVKPAVVSMEYFFADRKNVNSGKVLWSIGVIQVALAKLGYKEIIWQHQSTVKAAVCHGAATKKEIKEGLEFIFGMKFGGVDDALDGLAIAYSAQQGNRANMQ